eukprot:14030033-Alexandrium_andersonii.AAC.1
MLTAFCRRRTASPVSGAKGPELICVQCSGWAVLGGLCKLRVACSCDLCSFPSCVRGGQPQRQNNLNSMPHARQ